MDSVWNQTDSNIEHDDWALFGPGSATLTSHNLRPVRPFHDRSVQDPVEPGHPIIIKRSVFGLIRVFNKLPPEVVETKTVKQFQRLLQKRTKLASTGGGAAWKSMYCAS